MREFDEVRRVMGRMQDQILDAVREVRDELYDIPEDLQSELENLVYNVEYAAEDIVDIVDGHEGDFVKGGTVTVYNVPVTLTVTWDRDSRTALETEVQDYTRGWSPDEVEHEDGETIPSSSTQCEAWQEFLSELPGTIVHV